MITRPSALQAASALLRELAAAYQSATLYPSGHPQRTALGAKVATRVTSLRDVMVGDPTIFADHGSFYLDATLLAHESLTLGRLAEVLAASDIRSLTFTARATARDVEALIEVLREERARTELGGVLVNVAATAGAEPPEWHQRLTELRRAYAGGVDALRDAASRAAGGESIDIDVASRAVSHIADQVAQDPGYGLLLSAVKSYDEYTYIHMVNVCVMSVALGHLIGLRADQVMVLGLGALLHDIGKVFVPTDVLNTPGRLDEEQWRLIQRHPVDGAGMFLATGDGLYHPAASVLLEHHTGYDARGYPTLHGHSPSVPSRLVAVADCYDAITSKRSYRDPLGRHEALAIIRAAAGRELDPAAVDALTALLGDHPIGSLIELDTGEVAVVIRQHDVRRDQPTVLVLLDRSGTPTEVEERDLAAVGGRIVRRHDAAAVGIDLTRFILEGEVRAAGPDRSPRGLVHEPSPGEAAPHGYVAAHQHVRADELDGAADPDVAPPVAW
ncbi:MAG: HD domain-containing protein [Actinobacteria bacterium]|nr:HD domain-containing protein [Actinomycetota bacterium]